MNRDEAITRFHALVWPFSPTVLRAARYLVRNQAEADDIAQETMIKAFKRIDSFRQGTDMRAWLMTILRNTRIDHARAAASSVGTVSFDQMGAEPSDSLHEESSKPPFTWPTTDPVTGDWPGSVPCGRQRQACSFWQ